MVISYKEKNGRVIKRVITGRSRLRGEPAPDRHFSDTLLKAYYAEECKVGSRWRSGYTKNQIKRVHEVAMARDGVT